MEYHDHAAPFREGGAAPAETARTQRQDFTVAGLPVATDTAMPNGEFRVANLGETAGEMTAEQFAMREFGWRTDDPKFLASANTITMGTALKMANRFAKQRVEQAERRVKLLEQEIEQDGQMFAGGKALILKLQAKVAYLERERDTLVKEVNEEILRGDTNFEDAEKYKTRAEAAESELREMREAVEKLVTKLRRIFDSEEYKGIFTIAHIHGCKYDGENCGEELTAMAGLLARKAGS